MPLHDWTKIEPAEFHTMHVIWIGQLAIQLNQGLLPEEYTAYAERHLTGAVPDVLRLSDTNHEDQEEHRSPGGNATMLATRPKVNLIASGKADVYIPLQRRITIQQADTRKLIAIIEVVSPSNKSSASELQGFVSKSVNFLRQGVHVLIVDLFPTSRNFKQGVHGEIWKSLIGNTNTIPEQPPKSRCFSSFMANADQFDLYAETLKRGEPLPSMPLFLKPNLFVNIPLEESYMASFRGCASTMRKKLEGTTTPTGS